MSFNIITDTSANLPSSLIIENYIHLIPFHLYVDEKEMPVEALQSFDGKAFYDKMRRGAIVTTSQITPSEWYDMFESVIKLGEDVLFISMSSGVSGSFSCAQIAAKEIAQKYPDAKLKLIDTLGASLGEGLLVIKAAQLRDQGKDIDEVYDILDELRYNMCQVFTVDDLKYLKRGGRLSNLAAVFGMVLNIKPVLKGDTEGKIVAFSKVRGRKKSIEAMAQQYDEYVRDHENQVIGIAHADCKDDAEYLKSLIRKSKPPKDIITVGYEPVTGSHVGPGTLALFFEGDRSFRDT